MGNEVTHSDCIANWIVDNLEVEAAAGQDLADLSIQTVAKLHEDDWVEKWTLDKQYIDTAGLNAIFPLIWVFMGEIETEADNILGDWLVATHHFRVVPVISDVDATDDLAVAAFDEAVRLIDKVIRDYADFSTALTNESRTGAQMLHRIKIENTDKTPPESDDLRDADPNLRAAALELTAVTTTLR